MRISIKYFLLLGALFVHTSGLWAQNIRVNVLMDSISPNPNEIVYRQGQFLSLDDFQGDFEPGSDAIAMAYSGVALRYDVYAKGKEVQINIHLYPSFDKQKSWCLKEHRNEHTLRHEQKHFDITVISTCALYKALKAFSFTKNFQQEIEQLRDRYRKQNEEEQDRYDKETEHGVNKEQQRQWETKLDNQINKCKDCYL